MVKKNIPARKIIFIAGEGDSEQSLVKWLQYHADEKQLSLHLDCQPIGGGGYRTMLNQAHKARQRRNRHKAKQSILLVDTDRADQGHDSWSLDELRLQASKQEIKLCVQHPNIEGLFVRMFPGFERRELSSGVVGRELSKLWPEYQKPVDAEILKSKFSWDDLVRVTKVNQDLEYFLSLLGFSW